MAPTSCHLCLLEACVHLLVIGDARPTRLRLIDRHNQVSLPRANLNEAIIMKTVLSTKNTTNMVTYLNRIPHVYTGPFKPIDKG